MSEETLLLTVVAAGVLGLTLLAVRSLGFSAFFFLRERAFAREIEGLVDQSVETVVEYVRLQNNRR